MPALARYVLVLLLGVGLLAAPAAGDTTAQDAETFVQTNAREVIETLQAFDRGDVSEAEVRAEFRERIVELADVERITNFVLGRYRRSGDPQAIEEFREVFAEYAISTYEAELSNYSGQTLAVTGSITRNDPGERGDYVVRSQITGGDQRQPIEVSWRVLEDEDGALKVVDVETSGVWLAQTQREQILSIIGDAGGNVSAATQELRGRLAERRPDASDADASRG